MAEPDSITSKSQRLATSKIQENHPNPSKFYTNFLYKAVIASIFVVVLPRFPSQAPEFINQTLHTRSWELLQLIFVGIAVSYGLFSKRNDETEKEHSNNYNNNNSSKFDNAQSYVSRLLQVSSVFDDETESSSGIYENKVQTWSNQYYRGQPNTVVAPESSVVEEQRGTSTSSRIGEKPLLLPVRSLKSRVRGPDVETSNESSFIGGSLNRSSSNLGSKRFSRNSSKSKTGEFGGETPKVLGENVEENIVLRSPIPWRSRSGTMEMKEDVESPPLYSLPHSMEAELNNLELRSFGSQSARSSRTNSTSPSPQTLSPSHSLSAEDFVRKKSFHKSTTPPAPPPPPPLPPFHPKSPLNKSNSRDKGDEFFPQVELKRSIRSFPKEMNGSDPEDLRNGGVNSGDGVEWWSRTSSDGAIMAKSVRTLRSNESVPGTAKSKSLSENFVYVNEEKRSNEIEPNFMEKKGYTDKIIRENVHFVPKQNFSELPNKEKQEFLEQVLVETEEDEPETDDEDDDEYEEMSNNVQEVAHCSASDAGPDVDKKADEFIAKFREQIRLQRIASSRKSTGQLPRNSVR